MKVDGGIALDLHQSVQSAKDAEAAGYSGAWTAETNHDPFFPLLLAAEHTTQMELGTSIAVAFARNPMTLANIGWDLQSYSRGRFVLGLGSQIKPHITKRFSMEWSHPAARMREMVLAIRAIWDTWQNGTKLEFRGDFYTHTLMTPFFTPNPDDIAPYGVPKIFLAGVGELMTEVAGEVCDGFICHGFTTEKFCVKSLFLHSLAAVRKPAKQWRASKLLAHHLLLLETTTKSLKQLQRERASKLLSMVQHPPTAACSTFTDGAASKTSSTHSQRLANGSRWAMSSMMRFSIPLLL